jgi:hypothetical protein
MELTKEYFDQALKAAVAPLATKEDVHREVRQGVDELARMVADGFEDVQRRLDVTAQIKTFERKFQKLEEALHIEL